MAGLIQESMSGSLTPDNIRSKLHIPPQLEGAYQKIILAGMKVMFDKSTHQLMIKELDGPGDMATRLGKGMTGLMSLLWQQSNKTLPPNLIIPAGLELMAHAVDFLKKAGQDVTDQEFGEAVQVFIQNTLKAFHLDPEKVAMIGARGAQGEQAPAADAAANADQQAAQPAPEEPGMAAPDETQPQGV